MTIDEGYRLRYLSTEFFASINQLKANMHQFMTVTPEINDFLIIFLYQYKENYTDQEYQDVLESVKIALDLL